MPNRYRGGPYQIIESDLSRTLTSAEELGNTISQIFQTLDESKRRRLAQMLEGIKSGVVDPNEALVQGTPGGKLYERYFGVKPPEAPRVETTYGQREVPFEVTGPPSEEPEPYAGSFLEPTKTEKRVGGFQPQNIEQLKQHLIREELAGRKADPRLYALAGLTKSAASAAIIDPEFAKQQAKIKSNPALLRSYTQLQMAFPDEPPASIAQMVMGMHGVTTGEKRPEEIAAPKTPSFAKQKLLAIGAYKNASLAAQVEHWRNLEAQAGERLTLDQQREKNRVYGNIFSTVSRHVDPDLAKQVTDAYVSGTSIEDMPLGEELKKRVASELSQKDILNKARIEAMRTLAESRTMRQELDQQKFRSGIDRFNILMELNSRKLASGEGRQFQAALLKSIVEKLKNANTRQEGEQMLSDFITEHLGGEIGDYSTFQGIKESVGRMFNYPGLGTPSIKIPPKPSTMPGNVPRLVPPQGKGTPKSAEDFLKKYGGK